MVRTEIHKAVDDSVAQVLQECGPLDPAKADQLTAHIATVHMCVDQLLDTAATAADAGAAPLPGAGNIEGS